MVKKIIIILFLILLILFPPIFPKNLIKGENKNIKDYFGFVITYFNKDIERTSIWAYEVKGYNLNGIILKNINSEKSYIFSKEGELIKEEKYQVFQLSILKRRV